MGSPPNQPGSEPSLKALNFETASRLWREIAPHLTQPAPTDEVPDWAPPIEGYRFVSRLRTGGGGRVYEAFRRCDGRRAALKVIGSAPRPTQGPVLAARLTALDLRAASEIGLHRNRVAPCIPELLDSGECPQGFWFAVQFIEGTHFDTWCALDAHSIVERARKLAELCDSVAALHDRGIIHADLKPDNILVTPGGVLYIIDYGCSARTSASRRVFDDPDASPFVLKGTPDFMAPELGWAGDPSRPPETATVRSDVFALGAVACLVLTGSLPRRVPIAEDAATTLNHIANHPIAVNAGHTQGTNANLAAVLRKATAREPECRYTSAAHLGEDLRRWCHGQRVRALPRGLIGRALDLFDSNRAASVLGAATLLSGVVLAGSSAYVWWVNRAPARLRVEARDHVSLVARSGAILAEWGDGAGAAPFAVMCDAARTPSGKSVVLIGHGNRAAGEGLCAYDAYNPTSPLWRTGVGPRTFAYPRGSAIAEEARFQFGAAAIGDVFSDQPGDEVIVAENHVIRGACCVRVCTLDGDILYETWHYGHIYQVRWLSAPGLIVLMGVNSEAMWKHRGRPDAEMTWPVILCAVRPVLNNRDAWITTPSRPGSVTPEWYRCVMPPDLNHPSEMGNHDTFLLGSVEFARQPRFNDAAFFSARIGLTSIIVNERGEIVARPMLAHLEQVRAQPLDLNIYGREAREPPEFVDLPPISD
ncbi:MAG: serine/threonine protein kinase [Planctomycetes bacterium]|nr:serine/threonine protein kinase [Planctomycetota bacterium]